MLGKLIVEYSTLPHIYIWVSIGNSLQPGVYDRTELTTSNDIYIGFSS